MLDVADALDPSSDYDALVLGVSISEKKLRKNIHTRLIARLRHGMIREAEHLHASGVSFKRLEMLGLEYRYLGRYLQNKLTKLEMTTKLEKEIWHYAKRQMTWFRKDKAIQWVKTRKSAELEIDRFLKTGMYKPIDEGQRSKEGGFPLLRKRKIIRYFSYPCENSICPLTLAIIFLYEAKDKTDSFEKKTSCFSAFF